MKAANPDYGPLLRDAYEQIKWLREKSANLQAKEHEPVAITGIGCRFPGGAVTPETFWTMLCIGTDAIQQIPPGRWDASALGADNEGIPQYAGLIEGIDRFAAGFFGIAPREAEKMDPQHRILLEVAWEALENAGIPPDSLEDTRTGVYIGISTNDYSRVVLEEGGLPAVDAYFGTGNSPSAAAGRLSYALGLQGPCMSIDTACSSSLVAAHLACEALQRGECDLCIAGGVNLILRPEMHIAFARAHMLASDGRSKTFDASADGYVRGEGCGAVVLQRLSSATASKRRIWAVIRGSAVNQDGRSAGLSAPNGPAQQKLIRRALEASGVQPLDVGYVEAHGTGTPLGDPIELQAMTSALERTSPAAARLYTTSLKTNIGHLEAAAGVAGLIKTALILHHGEIPPHLHLRNPNPKIDWDRMRVVVPRLRTTWPHDQPKLAGVSSFGFAGTNAHLVLAAAPPHSKTDVDQAAQLLVLSAKSEPALRALALRYAEWFECHGYLSLRDVCFTAAAGRSHWKHRAAFAPQNLSDAVRELRAFASGATVSPCIAPGSTIERVSRAYLAGNTVDWHELDHGGDVTILSLPSYPFERESYWPEPARQRSAAAAAQEASASPQCYRVEWTPAPIAPHGPAPSEIVDEVRLEFDRAAALNSLGRYRDLLPALERAARAWARAALRDLDGVSTGDPRVRVQLLTRLCTLAGTLEIGDDGLNPERIDADIRRQFPDDTAELALLHRCGSSLASLVRGECDALSVLAPGGDTSLVAAVYEHTAPARSFNRTVACALHSWMSHRRSDQPVRILEAGAGIGGTTAEILKQVGQLPVNYTFTDISAAFLERAKTKFAQYECMQYRRLDIEADPAAQGFSEDSFDVVVAANVLHATVSISDALHRLRQLLAPGGLLVLLEITRPAAWLDLTFGLSDGWTRAEDGRAQGNPLLNADQWRHVLAREFLDVQTLPDPKRDGGEWQSIFLARKAEREPASWLLIPDAGGIATALSAQLHARGDVVCESIEASGVLRILDLRGCDARSDFTHEALRDFQRTVCSGALHLVRAAEAASQSVRVWLTTRAAQRCEESPVISAGGTLWGLGRVWAAEFPQSFGGLIDLAAEDAPEAAASQIIAHIDAAPHGGSREIAFRNGQRFVSQLTAFKPSQGKGASFSREGAYLITGGFGGLGLVIARWMARQGAGCLILAGRSPVNAAANEAVADIERLGARVVPVRADVADPADMARLMDEIAVTGMTLRGVIHAAGITDDCMLTTHDWERFEKALAPKVYGAWNLHSSTAHLPLDFFVLMSSAAGVLGPPGFGSYAAGNAYLDSLAEYRCAIGLPATSIGWGPWAGVGMARAMEDKQGTQWEASGFKRISGEDGTEILGRLAVADSGYVSVVAVDWSRYARHLGDGTSTLIGDLAHQNHSPSGPPANEEGLLTGIANLSEDVRSKSLVDRVRSAAAEVMGIRDSSSIDPDVPLAEYGLDSLMALSITRKLSASYGLSLPDTLLFDRPTVNALSEYLQGQTNGHTSMAFTRGATQAARNEPIAIIGMSCRFPGGANSPEQFWEMLRQGRDGIRPVPRDRWRSEEWFDPTPNTPGKINTQWGGFIEAVDLFDAQFFGISPREAEAMDPQQRLLLEVAYEALEDGAVPADRLARTDTGVFIGIYNNDYGRLSNDPKLIDNYTATGNSASIATGRLSYLLGLEGPSIAVDTACSSSLVAVHLACQSLRSGESSLALAGGVNLMLSPMSTLIISQLRMLSRDGRCKAFDALADGFVRGEGCGVVVLKPLRQAFADHDRILAVIRGSAVNQDGRSSGITSPNGQAQEAVIGKALTEAGVEAAHIGFVEAHGTGTALGDPIEAGALNQVLGHGRRDTAPLRIGSVKANIGHLEAAAGIAGLIKTVLALRHKELPPQPHFHTPNPHIEWDRMKLVVNDNLRSWARDGTARLAGVSSFGFSGTNAHVVIEEAPMTAAPLPTEPAAQVLTLSAKSESALKAMAAEWSRFATEAAFADICFTANTCRSRYPWRLALVTPSLSVAQNLLAKFAAGDRHVVSAGHASPGNVPAIALAFRSCSPHHLPAAHQLYRDYAIFRETVKECAKAAPAEYAPNISEWFESEMQPADCQAELAGLICQVAGARLWRAAGIIPDRLNSAGAGRLAAACVDGTLRLQDAMKLACSAGAAGSVIDTDQCQDNNHVEIAALPVEGEAPAFLRELARLFTFGVPVDWNFLQPPDRFRKVDLPRYPFQRSRYWLAAANTVATPRDPQPAPAHPLLGHRIRSISRDIVYQAEISASSPPFLDDHRVYGVPVVPATAFLEIALSAGSKILRCDALALKDVRLLQALGIHEGESRSIQCLLSDVTEDQLQFKIASFAGPEAEPVFHASGQILRAEPEAAATRVIDPTSLFNGDRLSAEDFYCGASENGFQFGPAFRGIQSVARSTGEALGQVAQAPELDASMADYFFHPAMLDACLQTFGASLPPTGREPSPYVPVHIASLIVYRRPGSTLWSRARLNSKLSHSPEVFVTDFEICDGNGVRVATIEGFTTRRLERTALQRAFAPDSPGGIYRVEWRPVSIEAPSAQPIPWLVIGADGGLARLLCDQLHATLLKWQQSEDTSYWIEVLTGGDYLGVVAVCAGSARGVSFAEERRQCEACLSIAQALVKSSGPRRLCVITGGSQPAPGLTAPVAPAHAAVWGLITGLIIEHPEIDTRLIDLDADVDTAKTLSGLVAAIVNPTEHRMAIRGDRVFAPRLTRYRSAPMQEFRFTAQGTYLITGGMGALGIATAKWIASRGGGHLVLMSRKNPSPEVLEECQSIEAFGARVFLRAADVANKTQLDEIIAEIDRELPPLRGVFHAAGVVDDALFANLTWPRLQEAMRPKILGARNLDDATSGRSLDMFVLYSSASAILGSLGQANYAAANAWLDALAHDRRQRGETALSVNWGPWAGAGMTQRSGASSLFERQGFRMLAPTDAFRALEALLQSDVPQAQVLPVDWDKVRKSQVWLAQPELFADIDRESPPAPRASSQEHKAIVRRILATPARARETLILKMITERAAAVLGNADANELSPHTALSELGMDSFTATELVQQLEAIAGRSLSPTIVFQHPTLAALARYIAQSLPGTETPRESELSLAAQAPEDEALLQEVATMEADTMHHFLKQFIESNT